MTNRLLGIVLVAASAGSLAVSAGCSDDTSSTGGTVDCESITVKGYAELTSAFSRCTNCHSSTLASSARNAAPVGSDYDTYEGAKQQVDIAPPRDLVTRVEDGTMPFVNYPQFQGTEKEDMLNWAKCGTPP